MHLLQLLRNLRTKEGSQIETFGNPFSKSSLDICAFLWVNLYDKLINSFDSESIINFSEYFAMLWTLDYLTNSLIINKFTNLSNI